MISRGSGMLKLPLGKLHNEGFPGRKWDVFYNGSRFQLKRVLDVRLSRWAKSWKPGFPFLPTFYVQDALQYNVTLVNVILVIFNDNVTLSSQRDLVNHWMITWQL